MSNENKDINEQKASENQSEQKPVMTEEELREQYEQLPMWKHVVLLLLVLFAMVAVFMLIDFVVDFLVELAKHIF